jgi:hypothetical protein
MDAKKRGDGSWLVQLTSSRRPPAHRRVDLRPAPQHVTPADYRRPDHCRALSRPRHKAPTPGEATRRTWRRGWVPRPGTPRRMGNSAGERRHAGSGTARADSAAADGPARVARLRTAYCPRARRRPEASSLGSSRGAAAARIRAARALRLRPPPRRRRRAPQPGGVVQPAVRPRGTRARLRTPASRRTPGPLRRARRRLRHRQPRTPPRWPRPRPPLRRYQPPRRYLPPRRPSRPRGKPSANRRRARAGRRRAGGGPRYRPGTRSCSAARASETSQTRARPAAADGGR